MEKSWKKIVTIATIIILIVSSNICSGGVRIYTLDVRNMQMRLCAALMEAILNVENGDSLMEYMLENNVNCRRIIKMAMEVTPIGHIRVVGPDEQRINFCESILYVNWMKFRRFESDGLNRNDTVYMPAELMPIGTGDPDVGSYKYLVHDSLYYIPLWDCSIDTRMMRRDISARDTIKYPVKVDYVRHWIDSIRHIPLRDVREELGLKSGDESTLPKKSVKIRGSYLWRF